MMDAHQRFPLRLNMHIADTPLHIFKQIHVLSTPRETRCFSDPYPLIAESVIRICYTYFSITR
jgi:hypothetical protein